MKHCALSAVMPFFALVALAVCPSAIPPRAAVAALDDINDNTTDNTNDSTEARFVGTTPGSREIVFVDARIAGSRRLIGDRENRGRGNRQIEIVVLLAGEDGIQRIGTTLRRRSGIDAVHILSHGAEGFLELGTARLDAASLRGRGAEIAHWGDALSSQGDLLLYGCNLAGGVQGKGLVERFARLTRADVAASVDPTGHERLGGDWHLEYRTGPIAAPVVVGAAERARWPGLLAITVNNTTTSAATSGAQPSLTWAYTVNAGSNRVLLVGLALETGQATGVTYGGVPLTLVGRHTGGSSHTIEQWRLAAPAVGPANVVATFDAAREALGAATTFDGVHQTNPTAGFVGNDSDSLTASVTITSATGDLVVDTVFVDLGGITVTPDPSQSQLWNLANGRRGAGSTKPGAASVLMTWGLSPDEEWTIAGVSLRNGPTISGVVFEDTAGDLLADGPIDGLNNPGLPSVSVYLYRDDGTTAGEPDAGDSLIEGPLATAANGGFAFAEDSDGTYWVVVDSQTIVPDAGLNPTWAASDVWAEQSYGPAGAVGYGGSYSFLGSAGAFYGGKQATVSDDAPAGLLASEHVARVVVSGASVNDVDFGFSFNTVTNVAAPDSGQNCCRSVQGSLDQFLQNSSAVDGPNTMRFVPAVPTNASGGGGNWWRIQHVLPVSSRLQFFDFDTIIDGTAYDSANGVTVLNPNPGYLGLNAPGGVTVGTDELALPQVAKPELEVFGRGFSPSYRSSAGTRSDRSEIRDLSAWGTIAIFSSNGAIVPAVTLSDLRYENNVIGTPPDAFSDPGAGANTSSCISFDSASSGHIVNNLIGFCDNAIIEGTRTSGWTITGNELRAGGAGGAPYDALRLGRASGSNTANSFTIEANHIEGHTSNGIDAAQGGGHTIRNNTVKSNGSGGVETAGIRLATDGNLVDRNVIQANTGPGVLVVGQDGGFPDSPGQQNQLTANHYGGNGGPGIDLVASGGSATLGDGPTPANQTPPNCGYTNSGGNRLIDAPIVDSAVLDGPTTTVTGRACANSTVELYRAAGDEGDLFVGLTTSDGGGNFSTDVTGLLVSDSVVAIVRDAAGETSEFGAALGLSEIPSITGTVFEDVNYGGGMGRDRATASADAPSFAIERGNATVELYDAAGTFVASTTSAIADGTYSFTGLTPAVYTVRVVNDTVDSSRPGSDGSELAVQVYRSDGDGESAGTGAKKVGGELPSNEDAAANSGAQTLASLQGTDLDTDGIPEWTQSIVRIDLSGGSATGVDFGFNFSTIVNTNDADQGSLRQFVLNSNLLH